MYYYEVAPTKIFRASSDILTYEHDQPLSPGTIVIIPLGKKTVPGLLVKQVKKPRFPTKPIEKILYDQPLPPHLQQSILWLSKYYSCPLPTVLQTALPKGIDKTRRAKAESEQDISKNVATPKKTLPETGFLGDQAGSKKHSVQIPLNSSQRQAISEINSCKSNTVLLHGITGSGKTNIYLELTRQTIKKGSSAIILVPEIALTSQLVQNFQVHFKDITLLHSKQTEATRHLLWENILKNDQPQVIIGPRSALFAPVRDLGLIIIDEAHEPAYHQDQAPKYSATQLASVMIGVVKNNKTGTQAFALMGTATPTITDYYLAKQRKAIITLDQLAIKNSAHANLQIVDLKDRTNFKKHHLFSDQLLTAIQNSLASKTQIMIFHNRRGSAPLTICDHCGWQAVCPRCLLPLNLHTDKYALVCHTCGFKSPVPTSCLKCQHANILHKGFGTKLIEAELAKLFPNVKIARFDADTETEKSLHLIYDEVKGGRIDIIIGTQMIAKGLDLPHLSTLGVVQADSGLALPDFSSEERTFQLLTQVIGRANRGHQDSNIIIQTYQPDHPAIKFGAQSNYQDFYRHIVKNRRASVLPPYSFLLKLTMTYKTESVCVKNINDLRKNLNEIDSPLLSISAPMPAFHERTPQGFTWQLIIKSKKRQLLLDIIRNLPKNPYLHFHLDPPTLL
ncbi:primosomal protein N' [Candidatus Saccharibacteria bacterium]|nr:primosomal protein N' [Candidatus Saccharibacteria bacterium]